MARRSNGFVAFAAGLGTGYLNGEKAKKDQERQDKKDKSDEEDRQARRDEVAYQHGKDLKTDAENTDYVQGMADANAMKTGELIDQTGAKAGLTAPDWSSRIDTATNPAAARVNSFDTAPQQVLTDEQKAAIADTYAQQSQTTGAADWVASDAPNSMIKKTTQSDILEAKANAAQKLGVRGMPQAEAYKEKASLEHVKDLQMQVLSPKNTLDDVLKKYDDLPDGQSMSHETDPVTGKIMIHASNDQTGQKMSINGPEGFANENSARQYLATMIGDNPDKVMALIDKGVAERAAAAKAALEERKTANAEKKTDNMITLQGMRDDAAAARLGSTLTSLDKRAAARQNANEDKTTPTQQANNAEIALARKRMAGMTVDDVKAKTQQFLPNGRDNPNFDQTISQAYRTANQHMVGSDPQFDSFSERAQPIKSKQTPKERFLSDPSMKSLNMGKLTSNGWEVTDSSGKIIGHWK